MDLELIKTGEIIWRLDDACALALIKGFPEVYRQRMPKLKADRQPDVFISVDDVTGRVRLVHRTYRGYDPVTKQAIVNEETFFNGASKDAPALFPPALVAEYAAMRGECVDTEALRERATQERSRLQAKADAQSKLSLPEVFKQRARDAALEAK